MRYEPEELKEEHGFSDSHPDMFPVYPPAAEPNACTSDSRIGGYDLARMAAMFGMTLVNLKSIFADQAVDPSWLYCMIEHVDGRAAATFVVLSGVGVSLLSRHERGAGTDLNGSSSRMILLKRALFLFVSGICLIRWWPADILHFFGLYLMLATFMLKMPERRLLVVTSFFITIFQLLTLFFDYEKDWNGINADYIDLWSVNGFIRNTFFNGFYPIFPWFAFLLLGMWLGRQEVRNGSFRNRMLMLGGLIMCVMEMISSLPISKLDAETIIHIGVTSPVNEYWMGSGPYPPSLLFMLSAGGTALVVITLSLEIGFKFSDRNWISPFLSLGRLSFTYYVAHLLLGITINAIIPFVFDDQKTLFFSLAFSIVFFTGSLGFAHWWMRRFPGGPLELMMRKFSSFSIKNKHNLLSRQDKIHLKSE
jgi:uncharacterized membrane protein YeiB